MFESLLVPLDRSKFSERSLPTAIALAGESGATLHLVHVHVPKVPYQSEGLDLNEYDRKHKIRDGEYLEEVARRVSGPLGERPSTSVLDGHVPQAIQRFADQSDAPVHCRLRQRIIPGPIISVCPWPIIPRIICMLPCSC